MPKYGEGIHELDLTENNFTGATDLRFLIRFPNLNTLILDKNQIQSNFIIPVMENLTNLCVNHNKISNLAVFVKNLSTSCPNLIYLSMLNNIAAPSYFNGGSVIEHKNYRFYVISRLIKLKMLDDKEIADEERVQANAMYGKLMSSKSNIKIETKTIKQKHTQQFDTSKIIHKEQTDSESDSLKNKDSENGQFTELPLPNLEKTENSILVEAILPQGQLPLPPPITIKESYQNSSLNDQDNDENKKLRKLSTNSTLSSSSRSTQKSLDYLENLPKLGKLETEEPEY